MEACSGLSSCDVRTKSGKYRRKIEVKRAFGCLDICSDTLDKYIVVIVKVYRKSQNSVVQVEITSASS